MKRIFRTTITATFVVVLLGMGFVSKAAAQCGPFGSSNVEISSHSCWAGQPQFIDASFAHENKSEHIVGFW